MYLAVLETTFHVVLAPPLPRRVPVDALDSQVFEDIEGVGPILCRALIAAGVISFQSFCHFAFGRDQETATTLP